MAKWGEGDERWRVADLGDEGRNVGNWHWVEKDAMLWCKDRLREVLCEITLAEHSGTAVQTAAELTVEGEAVINQRKGKLIPAYELSVTVPWRGTDAEGKEGAGEVKVPYLSEENHDEDPEVQVTVNSGGAAAEKMRNLIVGLGRPVVHKALATFVSELRAGGPMRGKAAPPAEDGGAAQGAAAASAAAPALAPAAAAAEAPKPAVVPSGGHTITLTEKFFASAKDIHDCFTDARRMQAFTQSGTEVDPRPGGRFSMFGGSIQGTFRELQAPRLVDMDWRRSDWEDSVISRVVIEIEEKEKGNVVVRLKQTGVPDADKYGHRGAATSTEAGWRDQVFGRIRKVFGYGV